MVGQEFENGRPDTAFAHTVFKGDEAPVGARHVEDEGFVERLGKAQVDVGDAQVRAFCGESSDGIGCHIANRTEREEGHITLPISASIFEQTSAPHFDGLQRAAPVDPSAAAARVADEERSFGLLLCGEHEAAQFVLVVGRGKGEVGDGTEVGNVETAVVGGSVFAHKPRAVEAEHHRKGEDGTVVNDVVVGALGKGGVDVAEGDEPIFGHTCREGGGVAFGNAHIKGAFGHRFGQQVHGATGEHGRRYAHDAWVALCEFDQRVAKHILKFRRLPVLARFKTFALLAVELARGVPDDRIFLSQFIALALGGVDVEQARAGHVFEAAQ